MPGQKKTPDPKTNQGFPEHGAPYVDLNDPKNNQPLQDDPPQGDPPIEDPPKPDPLEELKQQNRDLMSRLDSMGQELTVLKQSRQEPPPPIADPYDDVETKLFEDPAAVLRGMEDRIVGKVTDAMRGEYRKDQGEQAFWNEFYDKHKDLKGDDDLVKATLQGNMAVLGGMPVSKAVDRLADLTRDRIARYSKTPRQRPHVEGAEPPTPEPPKKEKPQVVTLSDVLRKRREKRRGHAA